MVALLEPAHDGCDELVLIFLVSGLEAGKLFCQCLKTGNYRLFVGCIDPERMGIAPLQARTIGIFEGNLRLADAPKPTNGLRLGKGRGLPLVEALVDLRENSQTRESKNICIVAKQYDKGLSVL